MTALQNPRSWFILAFLIILSAFLLIIIKHNQSGSESSLSTRTRLGIKAIINPAPA